MSSDSLSFKLHSQGKVENSPAREGGNSEGGGVGIKREDMEEKRESEGEECWGGG